MGWQRWAATLLLGYEGIAWVGEVLGAVRRDLLLPPDLFECEHMAAFYVYASRNLEDEVEAVYSI